MGINLPEEVVNYLSDSISANIREIEGALVSLKANSQYLNRRISTSLAKDVLKAYVHVSQKEISVNRITEIVCEYYEIAEKAFSSTTRTREVAQARHHSTHYIFMVTLVWVRPTSHRPSVTRCVSVTQS